MAGSPSPSQTLSRGLRALEILAAAPEPLSIAELADALAVHRSIAYRILRTLEDHSLVVRDGGGRLRPGPGLAVLAHGVSRDLQAAAMPELTVVSTELGMTAFVALWQGSECVTLVSVEPRHGGPALAQRPGTRHPVSRGAPGIAVQSTMTARRWSELEPDLPYRPDAAIAAALGYATSHDEVITGVSSVAVPLRFPHEPVAALAVVYIRSDRDPAGIAAVLAAAARRIEQSGT